MNMNCVYYMMVCTIWYVVRGSPVPVSDQTSVRSEADASKPLLLVILESANDESNRRLTRSVDSSKNFQSASNIDSKDSGSDLEPAAQSYGYVVYRPVIRYSQISRRTYAIKRPPPLSNYHNDYNEYDKFPTVA